MKILVINSHKDFISDTDSGSNKRVNVPLCLRKFLGWKSKDRIVSEIELNGQN